MTKILLLNTKNSNVSPLKNILNQYFEVDLIETQSGEEALEMIIDEGFDLVISHADIMDMTSLEFSTQLVMKNPMLSQAIVSSISKKEFHNRYEGLGILGQLSENVSKSEIDNLFALLSEFNQG
ncbi:MAG: hypothetical protein HOD92_23420 [Deltaproteobacteria bacterium]|jgi:DNA-binding NarL/FixJ family response regulator|nr:hypothetical protein [Deltaproteobacteria bacterium]